MGQDLNNKKVSLSIYNMDAIQTQQCQFKMLKAFELVCEAPFCVH